MEKPIVVAEWQGQEFEFVPKSNNWYWTVGILSVGSAIAAFVINNILFGIILLLAGGTTALLGSRRPALHTFRMTDRGIHVGEQLFAYDNILQFAIDEHEPKKLLFELKQGLVKVITIPLDNTDHRAIRTEFKNMNIEEAEHLNTLVAKVSDWMGLS
jgi:hypothetical protein